MREQVHFSLCVSCTLGDDLRQCPISPGTEVPAPPPDSGTQLSPSLQGLCIGPSLLLSRPPAPLSPLSSWPARVWERQKALDRPQVALQAADKTRLSGWTCGWSCGWSCGWPCLGSTPRGSPLRQSHSATWCTGPSVQLG